MQKMSDSFVADFNLENEKGIFKRHVGIHIVSHTWLMYAADFTKMFGLISIQCKNDQPVKKYMYIIFCFHVLTFWSNSRILPEALLAPVFNKANSINISFLNIKVFLLRTMYREN